MLQTLRRLGLVTLFVLLSTAQARAAATSMFMTGDPGDYIIGGRTLYFTAADGRSFNAVTRVVLRGGVK